MFVLQSCWQEYLTARIEQNLVMNCNCPITDCQAQPTSQFFLKILTDKDTIAKVTPLPRNQHSLTSQTRRSQIFLHQSLTMRSMSLLSMRTPCSEAMWSAAPT